MRQSDNEFLICPYCGQQHEREAGPLLKSPDRIPCDGCDRYFVAWAEADVTFYTRDIEGGEMLKAVLTQKEPT